MPFVFLMNDLTKKTFEDKVEIILKEFSFKARRERNSKECPCYSQNKPCHALDEGELNCFFCLCPEYASEKEQGGCRIGNPEGKGRWFSRKKGEIWDCSDCSYPHKEKNIRKYLNRLFGLDAI